MLCYVFRQIFEHIKIFYRTDIPATNTLHSLANLPSTQSHISIPMYIKIVEHDWLPTYKAIYKFQACDWEKNFKLTANLKKAYFSDLAQKKWLTYLEAQISAFFRVKDHKTLVLNTTFVVFGIFGTVVIALLVCKSDLSNMHTYL